ncbi:carboxylesterase/lipase family protein [Bordetella holmesii]|uniref:Carboxylic ester hydrolase n=2 Tax=Bordetella holmesii TaxID=35814 RepID=A0A158M7Z4_9BORD|nr:carboxylesterase family protein [Bordetella holmesii]AIT25104.1 alpha/beta hydrolase fold family protein [Bordetella holmesii 44057]EWM45667.1 alpha/beta hydrolase fold family protein [Bordetella holmesii 70147]EWM48537.1 alpha/beta hydrolase fold family protein [Bordetella holmesii 41130]EWM49791.1 alpha/beta hydrolase fold family protein [Bordetella holmesii 35009]AMD44348.1 carboxylesterase [Bordetella holmesii H558]
MTDYDIATVPQGRLRGQRKGGVSAFLGVPYAEPPVGALRLRSPRPCQSWSGARDALRPGPASLQTPLGNQSWLNEPPAAQSEDCLFLNVWTPSTSGRQPVLLWVHGGATRNGSGAAGAIDGAALAAHGVVVVTINYRLGALGGLAHPLLADPDTGLCANWGLQDKLAALRWVRDSIAAFGGDPARVTLAGQSSGAANVALIAQHGLEAGLYRGIITQSPPLFRPPMFAEMEAASAYTEALSASLGVDVAGLRQIDGAVLQQQEQAFAVSAAFKRPATAPVRDGQLIRQWPYDAPAARVPLLAGWTATEADFWFDLTDGQGQRLSPMQAPATLAELQPRAAALVAAHYAFAQAPDVREVIDLYAQGHDTAPAIWRALYTDLVFRAPMLHMLARHARAGMPAWAYEFGFPVAGSADSSPHAADVPFVFGNTGQAHVSQKIGRPAEALAVSQAMMGRWRDFIVDQSPGWSGFDPARPAVMRFGLDGEHAAPVHAASAAGLWPGYFSATQA